MNKLCRVCLAVEKTIKFDSIFDDNEKVANEIQILSGLIVIFVYLHINNSSYLMTLYYLKIPNENTANESALICHECSSKLQDAVQLRNLCLQSNCFFEQLSMNNAEDEIFYEDVEYIKSESDVEDDRLGDYFTDIKSEVFIEYSLKKNDHINNQQYMDNSTLYPYQKSYICDKCGEVVENCHRLELHFKNKHLGKSFKCYICMKQFTRNYDLMTHTRNVHYNQKFFECQQCSKSFSMKWNLTRHVKNQHSGDQLSQQDIKENFNAFTCEICCLCFSSQSVMHSHKISVHKFIEVNELNEKWLEKCPKCDKYMQTKVSFDKLETL